MERRVFITKVRPERRAEYIQAHATVSAEILVLYGKAGMRHCSVYLEGDDLVLILEGEDLDAILARLAEDPVDRAWQNRVGPMKADGDWRLAEAIFSEDW